MESFSRVSQTYQQEATLQSQIATELCNLIGPLKNQTIADLGCGTGIAGEKFLNNGNKVTFTDTYQEMLNECRNRIANATCIPLNINNAQEISKIMQNNKVAISNMSLQWARNPISTISLIAQRAQMFGFSIPIDGTLSDFYSKLQEYGITPNNIAFCTEREILQAIQKYNHKHIIKEYSRWFASPKLLCLHLKNIGATGRYRSVEIKKIKALMSDQSPIKLAYKTMIVKIWSHGTQND